MERAKSKTSIRQLIKRRDKLVSKLNDYKHVIRGTINERGNICGKAKCRCKSKKNPILHGPYNYLSHRSREKTNVIFLNEIKLKYASKGIDEYNKLIKLIYRISEINFKILRYHYERIEDSGV